MAEGASVRGDAADGEGQPEEDRDRVEEYLSMAIGLSAKLSRRCSRPNNKLAERVQFRRIDRVSNEGRPEIAFGSYFSKPPRRIRSNGLPYRGWARVGCDPRGVASNDKHLAPEHGASFNLLDRRTMGRQDEPQSDNTSRQQ